MASIHKEILIEARPEIVWAAVRDVGAVHQRLAPGFVVDARLEGDSRVVTFGNGAVVRELIVDIDDEARRLAYAAVGVATTHHNASMQVFAEDFGPQSARLDHRHAAQRPRRLYQQARRAGGCRHEADTGGNGHTRLAAQTARLFYCLVLQSRCASRGILLAPEKRRTC